MVLLLVQGGRLLVILGRNPTSHMGEDGILCLYHVEGTMGRQWGDELWDWDGPSGSYTGQLWGFKDRDTP